MSADIVRVSPWPYFICSFVLFTSSFCLFRSVESATFMGFIGLFGPMITHPSLVLVSAPYIMMANSMMEWQLLYPNYLMGTYLLFALLEWWVHKYIMHAYIFFPWIMRHKGGYLKTTCERHMFHHTVTNEDMKLQKIESKYEVILSWQTVIMFGTVCFVVTSLVCPQIPMWVHASVTATLSILWGYSWNTLHTDLHFEKMDVGIMDGPGILPIAYPRIFYTNHILHHNVKGKSKGNFNIIFIGADHLLGTYNMT